MTRLLTSGFELSNVVEGFTVNGSAPTFSLSFARSGGFGLRENSLGSPSIRSTLLPLPSATVSGRSYFFRFYAKILTPTPTAAVILGGLYLTGPAAMVSVQLNPDLTLNLVTGTSTVQGTASAPLAANTWHRIEIRGKLNTAANDEAELLVNGVQVAVNNSVAIGTTLILGGYVGWLATSEAAVDYDDVAINDDQGTAQNTFPGDGKVVLLKPVADSAVGTGWTLGTGTATGGNAFAAVDNAPPSGGTDLAAGTDTGQVRNAASAANSALDVQCTDYTTAGIGALDVINVVQPLALTAAPLVTSAKTGTLGIVSNPAGTIVAWATDAGTFWAGVAAGFSNVGWKGRTVPGIANPTVTKGTRPVLRINQVTASTRIAMVSFMGIMVDYTPDTGPPPAGAAQKPRIIRQAIQRAAVR